MIDKPWLQSDSAPHSDVVVLRPGWDSILGWGMILVACSMFLFFGYLFYRSSGNPIVISLGISFVVGCLIKLFEVVFRYIYIDGTSVKISAPLYTVSRSISDIAGIEWWQLKYRRRHYTFYRLCGNDKESLVILGEDAWRNLHEAIRYLASRKGLEPVLVKPPVTIVSHWVLLIVFFTSIYSFMHSSTASPYQMFWKILNFGLFRVFWHILTKPLSEYDGQKVWFYILLMSVVNLAALFFVSEADWGQVITWWLYSPLVEILFRFLFVELPKILRRSQVQA